MANASILAAFERMWQHMQTALSFKANANHGHVVDNISGLQSKLKEIDDHLSETAAAPLYLEATQVGDDSSSFIIEGYTIEQLEEESLYRNIEIFVVIETELSAKMYLMTLLEGNALRGIGVTGDFYGNITSSAVFGVCVEDADNRVLCSIIAEGGNGAPLFLIDMLGNHKTITDTSFSKIYTYEEIKQACMNQCVTLVSTTDGDGLTHGVYQFMPVELYSEQLCFHGWKWHEGDVQWEGTLTGWQPSVLKMTPDGTITETKPDLEGYVKTATFDQVQDKLNTHISNKSNPHGVSLSQLGITATATELNYMAGVFSNVQTQLNGKAASSHGTHVVYGTSASHLGQSSAGSATTVSRSDHTHALPALTSCTGTLTVEKGGTGATSASTARTNLGIKSETWTFTLEDGSTVTKAVYVG